MIKSANVAWAFYPGDKKWINDLLDQFFDDVHLDILVRSPKAIVAPHAWYIYSWPIAAWSYRILQDNRKTLPKTFVIMAPSHFEYFDWVSVWLYDKFETPLGTVDVDKKLWEQLIKKYPQYFSFNVSAYAQEHAVEVQLPFLQYIAKGNYKILPLVFGNVNPLEVGDVLYELSQKEDVVFVVSSDLSHYMSYDHAVATDTETLQFFVDQHIDKIVHGAEACGITPWLALTQIAKKAKWKSLLLHYANSWDTAWDKSAVVGYGSVVYY